MEEEDTYLLQKINEKLNQEKIKLVNMLGDLLRLTDKC